MAIVQEDGGGDYTTLAAAVAANETTIEIQETWSAPETANITIDDANTTIIATGASKVTPARHVAGTPDHFILEDNAGGDVINVTVDGVILDGLDIKQTGTGASDEGIDFNDTNATLTIQNCILSATTYTDQQDGIYIDNEADLTINVINTIILNLM